MVDIFAIDLIDFEKLSDAKKKVLFKRLQKRRNALQAQLEAVNERLMGVKQALKVVEQKTKRRS
jgi:hypothetical protein